jgi:hypothetical protein
VAEQRAEVDRLQVVESWIEAAPDGDWVSAFKDDAALGRMRSILEQVALPDLEVAALGGGMGAVVLALSSEGTVGLLEFWRDWLEPWDSFTLDVERIVEGPEAVVVEAVQRGRLHGSTGVVESSAAAVHYFRGGRLARIEFHLDRDTARRAAGL